MAVTREALERLIDYDWPGNVRELENVIERAVVLCKGADHRTRQPARGRSRRPSRRGRELSFPVGTPLEEIERRVIHATLEHTGGDKRLAAQLLGISTRTIYRKLAGRRSRGVAPASRPVGQEKVRSPVLRGRRFKSKFSK